MFIDINNLTLLNGKILYKAKKNIEKEFKRRTNLNKGKKQEKRKIAVKKENDKERKRQKSKKLLPIPNNGHYSLSLSYLPYLLKQNWEHLYQNYSLDKENKFYVYAHTDISKPNVNLSRQLKIPGIPFYIGKGTNNRAFDLKRNQGHGKKIKEVLQYIKLEKDIVHIIKDNLTEIQALILESKLIYFFGTIYGTRKKGVLYNLNEEKIPLFSKQKFILRKTK